MGASPSRTSSNTNTHHRHTTTTTTATTQQSEPSRSSVASTSDGGVHFGGTAWSSHKDIVHQLEPLLTSIIASLWASIAASSSSSSSTKPRAIPRATTTSDSDEFKSIESTIAELHLILIPFLSSARIASSERQQLLNAAVIPLVRSPVEHVPLLNACVTWRDIGGESVVTLMKSLIVLGADVNLHVGLRLTPLHLLWSDYQDNGDFAYLYFSGNHAERCWTPQRRSILDVLCTGTLDMDAIYERGEPLAFARPSLAVRLIERGASPYYIAYPATNGGTVITIWEQFRLSSHGHTPHRRHTITSALEDAVSSARTRMTDILCIDAAMSRDMTPVVIDYLFPRWEPDAALLRAMA
jgi:hypothetical protein